MSNISPDLTGIKNIVFDFGRVLLDIDPRLTQMGLAQLEYKPDDATKRAKDDEIVVNLETGKISAKEFIDAVLEVVKDGTNDEDIIRVWNAMLLDFPERHVETLRKLRETYNIFLLSNSNQIHYDHYMKVFSDKYGFDLSDLFDKMWFSFQLGVIKPDPRIFEFILHDAQLKAEETLFVDDTLMHVEAAMKLGIRGFHLSGDNDISDLF